MDQENKIKTFGFKPSPVEIEIKDLSFTRHLGKLMSTPHKVSFYQLIWIKEGQAKYKIDFQEVCIHSNEILVISPGQICEFDTQSNYSGKLILFTNSFFSISEKDASFLHTSQIMCFINLNKIVSANAFLMDSLTTLLDDELQKAPNKFQSEISQSILRIILLEAERCINIDKPLNPNSILYKFYNSVEEHFKENRKISYYTNLLGVGEKTLTKELKERTGETPKTYIDKRIILEAKRLLVYSNLSVKEIGFSVGFEEPANFNNFFRKHIKQTPIQFRESMK